MIRDFIRNRKQIMVLAETDLRTTYSGTVFGFIWSVIKPALSLFVYWFALVIGLKHSNDVGGYSFFLWLSVGIVPWFYISEMISNAGKIVKKYSYLITKHSFPVSIIPIFYTISRFVVHIILLVVLMCIFTFNGYFLDIYFIQLIYYVFCLFVFLCIFSIIASYIGTLSKDFHNFLKIIVMPLFWFSGIFFDSSSISIVWFRNLLQINPITYIVNGYRDCFINKEWFFNNINSMLIFWIVMFVMVFLSIYIYRKTNKHIPDYL